MIRVDVVDSLTGYLAGVHRNQVPYALSRAVNQTAKDVQAAERQELRANFILRQPRFLLESIRIPKFSNKADTPIQAEVVIGGKATVLRKFQEAGERIAPTRDEPIAIPTLHLRPTSSASVPRAMYPRHLRLQPRRDVKGILAAKRHVTRRGVVQIKGKRRTFVLDPTLHFGVKRWGVYERIGPKRSDIRLLWIYKDRIRIPQLFRFHPVGEQVTAQRWPTNFAQAWAQAIATAR